MSTSLFPKNFVKLQSPPVIKVVRRLDGVISVDLSGDDFRVGAGTVTGTTTKSDTATTTYTGTDTKTYTACSTATSTAKVAHLGEASRVVGSTVKEIEATETQMGGDRAFAVEFDPDVTPTSEVEGVEGVDNLTIGEVQIGVPSLSEAGTTTIDSLGNPVLEASSGLIDLSDIDADRGSDTDTDGDYDEDSDSDTDTDGDYDHDDSNTDGVSFTYRQIDFKPPLAPEGTRGRKKG